jgi:hypothetical protein
MPPNLPDEKVIPARFIVGIDLGTTNCAVAFIDTESSGRSVRPFAVKQWVDWQTLEARVTLPSFHYQWTSQESSDLATSIGSPYVDRKYGVGCYARDRGADSPDRLISSAKSWLCHPDVDRTSPILPWQAAVDVDRISPVEASSRYLRHIREAWNEEHPKHPLEECEVVITLPASFDEVARELTIKAAGNAGLPKIVLIEEPQAAFYAWLHRHELNWQQHIHPGQTILICDIGGGTTDFTLIRVRDFDDEHQAYGLHRVAVGKHLMLGGDNLDIALAKALEYRFTSSDSRTSLTNAEWESLRLQSRQAKESLLGRRCDQVTLTLAGTGSRLIGTTRSVQVDRELLESVLIDGFFPPVALSEKPTVTEVGFFEFGLPYENDPAVTRHLAEFLWEHRWAGRPDSAKNLFDDVSAAKPDWILFNGGVLEAVSIRERLLDQLRQWFCSSSQNDQPTQELDAENLDLAVAIGAAYFGRTRRGEGVKIDARLARAYYLQISYEPPRAICVMPADAKTLDKFELREHPFELETNRPVQFPIWVSSTHLVDRIGEVVDIDLQWLTPLPTIQTVIETSRSKRIQTKRIFLESVLTEIGTLDLSLVSAANEVADQAADNDGNDVRRTSGMQTSPSRWRLAFDLRSTVETDRIAHLGSAEKEGIVDASAIETASATIRSAFTENAPSELAKNLVKQISKELDLPRDQWKPSLLRALWQTLMDCEAGRKRSLTIEARWLNLLGYCLRPGYGFAADDWRVQTTWKRIHGKICFPGNVAEYLILWRRLAGGFTAGHQLAIWQELQSRVQSLLESGRRGDSLGQDAVETLRLVGSLELLTVPIKAELGEVALRSLERRADSPLSESILWMLGRIGARKLAYGPMSHVVPTSHAEDWIARLCKIASITPMRQFAILQLARKTGDRFRDLSIESIDAIEAAFNRWEVSSISMQSIREVVRLGGDEEERLLGDSLPLGIKLRS